MIKLIASDLDGTLIRDNATALDPEYFELIQSLKTKGIHFLSASGRQLDSQRKLFTPIVDDISYIAENGAVCVHENETIATFEISRELCFRIINEIEARPHCKALVSTPSACYIKSGDSEYEYMICNVLKNTTIVVDDFSLIKEPIIKLALMDYGNVSKDLIEFRNLFQTEIKVMTAGNVWIDFMPYDTNKGTALKILLNKLGIKPEEVIAFGDQENDVEMLELAGVSYAMSTAKPSVQNKADFIIDSVKDVLKGLI